MIMNPARIRLLVKFSSIALNKSKKVVPVGLVSSIACVPSKSAQRNIPTPETTSTPCGLYFL